MYAAGATQASLLTQDTRPSGSVYAQVAYNAVTSAVTQVTDSNGGTWKLAAPYDKGSSQVYVGSVLGQGPKDYWRLADTGTSQAVNQINGGTATYSTVTEGATGPFADATADSFNGTSSNIALPSADDQHRREPVGQPVVQRRQRRPAVSCWPTRISRSRPARPRTTPRRCTSEPTAS